MKAANRQGVRRTGLVVALTLAASCVNDKIVYRETPGYTEPPAAAASYVGYSNTDTKQTTCGNCHVDWQTKWAGTKHADAWKSLEESGHAAESCVACHSVSSLGNADETTPAGYAATKDARYGDVQCENCHGKGLAHITSPKSSNRPLASIAAYDYAADKATGCGECHTGTHEPFVDEWKESAHGLVPNQSHASSASCQPCHNAQGALNAWGVTSNFVEKGADPQPITCAVCHDPHKAGNGKQLRFAVDVADTSANLCMKCHRRNAVFTPTNSHGPHSPEGPTLIGLSGWWPDGITDTLIATHGTDKNPKLCAGCHVNRFTVTDPKTGAFAFQATGHRFEATPCLDTTGKPVAGPCEISAQSFKACTASGCHGSEQVARSAFLTAKGRLTDLGTELKSLLDQVDPAEFNYKDQTITVAEGAMFNYGFVDPTDEGHLLGGSAVHNPFLIESLLTASIKKVRATYNLTGNTALNLNNILPQQGLK